PRLPRSGERLSSKCALSPHPTLSPSGGEGIGPAPSPSLRERTGVRVAWARLGEHSPLEHTGGHMASVTSTEHPVRWRGPGDCDAFVGLCSNVVRNVIVPSGLPLGGVKMPGDIVFGRILPALAIALPLGNLYYAWLAYRLARAERRDTVTAMPYGPSVPHMFIVVFLIMLPVALRTGNPILAWQAGLAWCFVIGVIILLGAFVGPAIRKYTPRAAMLGTLAGISITFISMRPAFQSWEVPWIAFISLAIIMASWMANVSLPG